MNGVAGWALAALGVSAGYWAYGWQGSVVALTLVVFWLLLQFSRALRAMRAAASRPVGFVDNAVMLHAKLRSGLRLVDIIVLTRSLGHKLSDDPERYVWQDAAGDSVVVDLPAGRCTGWRLQRAAEPASAG